MGRTLLAEHAESCNENQLVNRNNILCNIYFYHLSNPRSCRLLQLNPGGWGEHLTDQLPWAAAWLLVTCLSPVYLVVNEFSPCVLWPLMIALMVVLLTFFPLVSMVLVIRSWCYCKEWAWNLRTKLCWIASGKWNVSRVSLHGFGISYVLVLTVRMYISGLMDSKSE